MASLLMLLVVAVGAKGDVASPLEFQFQNTVGWNHLGTSVYAGNNLTVAYNGSHTHVLDASTLPKGMEVQELLERLPLHSVADDTALLYAEDG